ncbi:MAG: pyridoxal-dependent decarboxylase, partial [bacterium]
MKKPVAPKLESEYALTALPDIDLNEVINEILGNRGNDPIVQPSQAADLEARLPRSFPLQGASVVEVLDQLQNLLDSYCRRSTHPGFFGYIASGGAPVDPLSHAVVAAYNQNLVGYPSSPAAATIERKVIRWLCELAGLPQSAEGMFLGGGSLANLTALSVATSRTLGNDFRRKG